MKDSGFGLRHVQFNRTWENPDEKSSNYMYVCLEFIGEKIQGK